MPGRQAKGKEGGHQVFTLVWVTFPLAKPRTRGSPIANGRERGMSYSSPGLRIAESESAETRMDKDAGRFADRQSEWHCERLEATRTRCGPLYEKSKEKFARHKAEAASTLFGKGQIFTSQARFLVLFRQA